MTDRVTGRSARTLHTDPPGPEYRQIGWHCIYHEQSSNGYCHNPLDCDKVPLWALTVKAGLDRIVEAPRD